MFSTPKISSGIWEMNFIFMIYSYSLLFSIKPSPLIKNCFVLVLKNKIVNCLFVLYVHCKLVASIALLRRSKQKSLIFSWFNAFPFFQFDVLVVDYTIISDLVSTVFLHHLHIESHKMYWKYIKRLSNYIVKYEGC